MLVARLPGDRDRLAATEALLRKIRATVDDPKLRTMPILRVAQAVVAGELPEKELDSILVCLGESRRNGQLLDGWRYFVTSAQRAFARHGLAWSRPKPREEMRN